MSAEPFSAPKGRGVCMMSTSWRDKQQPDLINFIATFLFANSYRLNFLSISPDFIFNNGGVSVAFVFETNWDCQNGGAVFSRVNTLKRQFKYLYVVVAVPTREQNESFNQSYFKYNIELGFPTFVPVNDPEMGFEKIVKIAHAIGVCKQREIIPTMRNEREQAVQCMDSFLHVLTSIPGIDNHDANAFYTSDKLILRGWPCNALCILCDQHPENLDHLLCKCVFSRDVAVHLASSSGTDLKIDCHPSATVWWESLTVNKTREDAKRMHSGSRPESIFCGIFGRNETVGFSRTRV